MIYCIPPMNYPTPDQLIQETVFKDKNDFAWKIARVQNGFIIKYCGTPYFQDKTFQCELDNGKSMAVNNTGCIFVDESSFDSYCTYRSIIIDNFTDDIWDAFRHIFTARFNTDKGMLECEMIKPQN